MRREARGIDIGHLEYAVGPSGASDAVTGTTCAAIATLDVVIIIILKSVQR
jgi:hypothetical protein